MIGELPYACHGGERAPVLVLGNSLGTTQAMWSPLLAELGDAVRALTFDLPGHVRAEASDFTFDDIVTAAIALLDRLSLRDTVYCGVSLGGALGVAVAARRPDLVRRLVVVNAPIRQPSAEFWYGRAEVAERTGLEPFASTLADRWFEPGSDPDVVAAVTTAFRGIPPLGYAQACRAIARLDISDDAARVKAETEVVAGESDVAVGREHAVELAAAIPGAAMRTVPGAHLLPADRAGDLAALLSFAIDSRGAQ
ncbi:alpha/beta fold hydrolase [Thermopolyspora sp. NPDC052614]|uniref:alpha/beta fold hydrolase n=1 Tax=Thermopolyspora sp. NPDC052614 TaxID=3155682 RepID=UPI00342537F6